MELTLYFLLLIFLTSDGDVVFIDPPISITEAECKDKMRKVLVMKKPDFVVGFATDCIKVTIPSEKW